MRKYTDEAQDSLAAFPPGVGLWWIGLRHECKKSVLRSFIVNLNAYLMHLHAENPEMPASVQELRRDMRIPIVITRNNNADDDPNDAGFKNWAIAMYCAGQNFGCHVFEFGSVLSVLN